MNVGEINVLIKTNGGRSPAIRRSDVVTLARLMVRGVGDVAPYNQKMKLHGYGGMNDYNHTP